MKEQNVRIGISGWTFPDWRGPFYPDTLTIKQELKYASCILNAIEVNGTFYGMQKPHTFEKWYEETPPGFKFAIKAPKYVTHDRRLRDVGAGITNFVASGILALKEKLGPILWQLPPNLIYDKVRIENFLEQLPHTTKQASEMGKSHSDWMKGRTYLEVDEDRPILHALEVRHESFKNKEFVELMKQYKVAIVIGDTAGRWPYIEEYTSPLIYIRLHGDETLFPKGYTKPALQDWTKKINEFSKKVNSIYAFCDNDHKTAAPKNAVELKEMLKLDWNPEPLYVIKEVKAKAKEKIKTKSKPATNDRAVGKSKGKSGAKNKPLNRVRKVTR